MTRLVGNYVLGDLLGRGGMSEVYAGQHRYLGDRVAVKLMRAGLAASTATTGAFLAEAARTRAIEHPNVIRVLDFGRDDASGSWYLVMEHVDGPDLATLLAQRGPISETEVRMIGAAIADGMQAAHERGIVHRDLKPGNVMMCGDTPKIVDFGIARSLDGQSAVLTSRRIGTPAYMAPEQMTGGLIAPAVDVWALGVILYEAAAGQPPFSGFDEGRCPQLLEAAPRLRDTAEVSASLSDTVARCLHRDPGQRVPSMADLACELRRDPERAGMSDAALGARLTEDLGPALAAPPPLPTSAAPVAVSKSLSPSRRTRAWLLIGCLGAAAAVLLAVRSCASGPDRPVQRSTTAPRTAPAADARPRTPNPPDAARSASPEKQRVSLISNPPGAHVLRAGALIGLTPARLSLTLPVTLTLRKAGHRPTRVRIEKAGPVRVRLSKRVRRPRPPRPKGETLD